MAPIEQETSKKILGLILRWRFKQPPLGDWTSHRLTKHERAFVLGLMLKFPGLAAVTWDRALEYEKAGCLINHIESVVLRDILKAL